MRRLRRCSPLCTPGRVVEHHLAARLGDDADDPGARGLRLVGDGGDALADQPVEERRLAGVGPAHQRHRAAARQRRSAASSAIAQPAPAQPALEPIHLAVVALVIVAHAVQHAVEKKRLHLALEPLTARRGLPPGLRHAHHHVAEVPGLDSRRRRETTARRSPRRGRGSRGSSRASDDRRTVARSGSRRRGATAATSSSSQRRSAAGRSSG